MKIRFSGRKVVIEKLEESEGNGFRIYFACLGPMIGGFGDSIEEAIQSLVSSVEMTLLNEDAIEEHLSKPPKWFKKSKEEVQNDQRRIP